MGSVPPTHRVGVRPNSVGIAQQRQVELNGRGCFACFHVCPANLLGQSRVANRAVQL